MFESAKTRRQEIVDLMGQMYMLSKAYEDSVKEITRLSNRIETKMNGIIVDTFGPKKAEKLDKIKKRDERLKQKYKTIAQLLNPSQIIPQSDWEWLKQLQSRQEQAGKELKSCLSQHPIWPFLEPLRGLKSAHVGRIISTINDPRRFPGQPCNGERQHIHEAIYEVGTPCPVMSVPKDDEEPVPCDGVIGEPRPHTGVRSLWHYFGLHVVDNGGESKLPRLQEGQQADWDTQSRSLILGDKGIADQIVMHKPQPYESTFREMYERKSEEGHPRPNKVGRVVAAKQFLGDLLMNWKDLEFGAGPPVVSA